MLVLLQLRVICVSSVILFITAKGKVAALTVLCHTELLKCVCKVVKIHVEESGSKFLSLLWLCVSQTGNDIA